MDGQYAMLITKALLLSLSVPVDKEFARRQASMSVPMARHTPNGFHMIIQKSGLPSKIRGALAANMLSYLNRTASDIDIDSIPGATTTKVTNKAVRRKAPTRSQRSQPTVVPEKDDIVINTTQPFHSYDTVKCLVQELVKEAETAVTPTDDHQEELLNSPFHSVYQIVAAQVDEELKERVMPSLKFTAVEPRDVTAEYIVSLHQAKCPVCTLRRRKDSATACRACTK
eukprot:scpid83739/ scgid34776/ 